MNIQTKFDIGDHVYLGRAEWVEDRVECPTCKGSGYWHVVAHSGELGSWQVTCYTCKDHQTWSDTARGRGTVKQSGRKPVVTPLTVGSVQLDTNREEETRYMCVETGVGSGTCWSEKDLFHTAAEALAHAEAEVQRQLPDTLKLDDDRNERKKTSELCHMTRPKRVKTKKVDGPRGWSAFIPQVYEVHGYSTEKAAIKALAEALVVRL